MTKISRLIFGCILAVSNVLANDIDTLFSRTRKFYALDVSADSIESLILLQHNDGSWEGPVYNKKGHTPIEHLENARFLASGYDKFCSEDRLSQGDFCKRIKLSALKALLFWFSHKNEFESDNWWMNEIGIQRQLAPICFLLWNEIPASLKKLTIECFPQEPSGNGTNRSWISELVAVRGILEQNASLIRLGTSNIEKTMAVTNQEGHQADHSFYMHGNQLYNGCYGKSALSLAARWASIVRETDYSFSNESVNSMALLALEGNRWMMWMGMVDAMTVGREIALKTDNKESFDFRDIIENLASVDTMHKFSYETWRQDISGQESQSGCRYFWRGEMMVCKSQDFYVSLKMSSSRTVGSEFLNRENRKGLWLGMGVLSVYRHPDDYKDIYPLWNWSMLPGVTSYGEANLKEKRVTNKSDYVGGIGDEQFGAAAMILNRPKLSAKKFWFFLDSVVVALGSEISSSHNAAVKTTLDQRLVHSEILMDDSVVWHDGIGYKTLDGQKINVKSEKRTGNWASIGTQKIEENGDVVSLWIDHGARSTNGNYEYLVAVGVGKNFYQEKSSLEIVQNDGKAQVVYDEKLKVLAGVVYKRGRLDVGLISLSFDEPTIFLLRRKMDSCLLKTVKLPNVNLEAANETEISCPIDF